MPPEAVTRFPDLGSKRKNGNCGRGLANCLIVAGLLAVKNVTPHVPGFRVVGPDRWAVPKPLLTCPAPANFFRQTLKAGVFQADE